MNSHGKARSRFLNVPLVIGGAGALLWLAWANYAICLWWMTPASPDGRHIMEWVEHGRTHFLTVGQQNLYSHLQRAAFIGLITFFVLTIGPALIDRGSREQTIKGKP